MIKRAYAHRGKLKWVAEHVGYEAAHEIIFECAGKAAQVSLDLAEVVGADPRILAHMSLADIGAALDPVAYLGQSMSTLDAAITGHEDSGVR